MPGVLFHSLEAGVGGGMIPGAEGDPGVDLDDDVVRTGSKIQLEPGRLDDQPCTDAQNPEVGLPGFHPVLIFGKFADLQVPDWLNRAHQTNANVYAGHPLPRSCCEVGAKKDFSFAGQFGAHSLSVAAEQIGDWFNVFVGNGDA